MPSAPSSRQQCPLQRPKGSQVTKGCVPTSLAVRSLAVE